MASMAHSHAPSGHRNAICACSRSIIEAQSRISLKHNKWPLLCLSHSRRRSASILLHRADWARSTHWSRQDRCRKAATEISLLRTGHWCCAHPGQETPFETGKCCATQRRLPPQSRHWGSWSQCPELGVHRLLAGCQTKFGSFRREWRLLKNLTGCSVPLGDVCVASKQPFN